MVRQVAVVHYRCRCGCVRQSKLLHVLLEHIRFIEPKRPQPAKRQAGQGRCPNGCDRWVSCRSGRPGMCARQDSYSNTAIAGQQKLGHQHTSGQSRLTPLLFGFDACRVRSWKKSTLPEASSTSIVFWMSDSFTAQKSIHSRGSGVSCCAARLTVGVLLHENGILKSTHRGCQRRSPPDVLRAA